MKFMLNEIIELHQSHSSAQQPRWLIATMLNTLDIEHFHHHQKFNWAVPWWRVKLGTINNNSRRAGINWPLSPANQDIWSTYLQLSFYWLLLCCVQMHKLSLYQNIKNINNNQLMHSYIEFICVSIQPLNKSKDQLNCFLAINRQSNYLIQFVSMLQLVVAEHCSQ